MVSRPGSDLADEPAAAAARAAAEGAVVPWEETHMVMASAGGGDFVEQAEP